MSKTKVWKYRPSSEMIRFAEHLYRGFGPAPPDGRIRTRFEYLEKRGYRQRTLGCCIEEMTGYRVVKRETLYAIRDHWHLHFNHEEIDRIPIAYKNCRSDYDYFFLRDVVGSGLFAHRPNRCNVCGLKVRRVYKLKMIEWWWPVATRFVKDATDNRLIFRLVNRYGWPQYVCSDFCEWRLTRRLDTYVRNKLEELVCHEEAKVILKQVRKFIDPKKNRAHSPSRKRGSSRPATSATS